MKINIKFFLLLFFVSFVRSQDSTPIVYYSFKSDLNYQETLLKLETSFNKTKDKKLVDSIAQLSFNYKDWENSIKYLQMSLKIKPNSKYFFLLGAASGYRSLEVPIFSSTKYVKIMKRAFQEAVNLEPKNILFLIAQVDVLVSIPSIFGGSIDEAKRYIQRIKELDPIEGLVAEGLFYEKTNDIEEAGQTYNKLFLNLLSIFDSCSDSFLNYLKKNRRNLAYDIGRIASDYQLSTELGICALSFYEERHILPDSIPLPWVYYHIAKLEKMKGDISRMEIFISKVKPYKNDYPSISSLINQLIQQ
ncbi:MAG: hypothetical protein CBC28_05845 [Flavobacteriaceae bacterium TMED68]|nr:MAG: hypothetical protein CBC28_05845 [Flavobacteriaceae bacterium TMED68]